MKRNLVVSLCFMVFTLIGSINVNAESVKGTCSNHTDTSKHIHYVYYKNSCNIHYRYYLQNDNKTIKYAYAYNTSNQKTHYYKYYDDYNTIGHTKMLYKFYLKPGTSIIKYAYKYDMNGRQIVYYKYYDGYNTIGHTKILYRSYLKPGTSTINYAYKYDTNGNRINKYYYHSSYNTINNHKVKKKIYYSTSGKWQKENNYTTSGSVTGSGSIMTPLPKEGRSQGYTAGVHDAIDYAYSDISGDNIYSADSGKVIVAKSMPGGCGNGVVVSHGNNKLTEYCHMSSISVSKGDTVAKGTVLGHVGSTGNSSGPHLHFGVVTNGKYWYADGSYQGNPQFANPDSYIKEHLKDKPGW